MNLFAPPKGFTETVSTIVCSEQEALTNLENAAKKLVKLARWHPFRTKIGELRRPLAQLKLAHRRKTS